MRATKAARINGQKPAQHRAVDRRAVPMDALFWPWELVDWAAIKKAVTAGRSVHIEDVSVRDAKHLVRCAYRELGRQNVYAAFCDVRRDDRPSYGVWIMPREAVAAVLIEGFTPVED